MNVLKQNINSLDKHIQGLETLRKQLCEERKEYSDILAKGSNILKYDAGDEIDKKTNTTRIPKSPRIAEYHYINCHDSKTLISKSMGSLKENITSITKPGTSFSEAEKQQLQKYQTTNVLSSTENTDPNHSDFSPIGNNADWVKRPGSDKMLCLIDSRN